MSSCHFFLLMLGLFLRTVWAARLDQWTYKLSQESQKVPMERKLIERLKVALSGEAATWKSWGLQPEGGSRLLEKAPNLDLIRMSWAASCLQWSSLSEINELKCPSNFCKLIFLRCSGIIHFSPGPLCTVPLNSAVWFCLGSCMLSLVHVQILQNRVWWALHFREPTKHIFPPL